MRRFAVLFAALALLLVAPPQAQAYADLTAYQWALRQIGAPAAWQVATGAGITVGVVDSGADAGHPDFGGRVSTVDCTNTGGNPGACRGGGGDEYGHGTHVTGIIGAGNDGSGTTGVAPSVNVIVAKVFQCNANGCNGASSDDIGAAVEYLKGRAVAAINLSLGSSGLLGSGLFCNNNSLRSILNGIWEAGAVPVFAAGNCGGGGGNYSGVNALVVGSSGPNGTRASYSNDMSGAQWGVAAPGGDGTCAEGGENCILSTWPRNNSANPDQPYYLLQGTSMAAPHVTGAVALLRSKGLSKEGAVNALMGSLDPMACGSGCQGRINVQRAAGAPNVSGGGGTGGTGNGGGSFGGAGGTVDNPPPPRTSPSRRSSTTRATTPTTAAPVTTTAPLETTTTEAPATTTSTSGAIQSAVKKPNDSDNFPLVPAGVAAVGFIGSLVALVGAGFERLKGGAGL